MFLYLTSFSQSATASIRVIEAKVYCKMFIDTKIVLAKHMFFDGLAKNEY